MRLRRSFLFVGDIPGEDELTGDWFVLESSILQSKEDSGEELVGLRFVVKPLELPELPESCMLLDWNSGQELSTKPAPLTCGGVNEFRPGTPP